MGILDRAACFAAITAACLAVSGCANNLSNKDLPQMGRYEIAYLQPEANFTANNSAVGGYAVLYLLAGPLAVVGGAAGVSQKNEYQQEALAANAGVIRSLGFDDRVQAVFVSAIDDSWLPRKDIKTVPGMDSPDDYTHQSSADSVIYLMPKFALTSFGHVFEVDVTVGVQKYLRNDPNPHVTHIYTREFTFKHDLVLKKPGMTWDQQVDAGHQLAQLGTDEAVNIWLENNGERLRTDFEEDLPAIEAGVREFFGDQPAVKNP